MLLFQPQKSMAFKRSAVRSYLFLPNVRDKNAKVQKQMAAGFYMFCFWLFAATAQGVKDKTLQLTRNTSLVERVQDDV